MVPTSCSGCSATFADNNSFRWIIKVSLYSPEGTPIRAENPRHLCDRCMVKIRPALDVIDGKTESIDDSLPGRIVKIEKILHETYHQFLDQRIFQIEVALGLQ